MSSVPVPRYEAPAEEAFWQSVDACERMASVFFLAALSPVLIASTVALSVASGRSPLIAHRRVGWRGETLWMLKLRTMWQQEGPRRWRWVDYIEEDPYQSKKAEDSRIGNWFARFCRRHSIDEIPQLWHVIRGEMSLVGPRPMTPAEIREQYGKHAREVLQVKPGIAGLWQTSGRNRLSYAERCELDLRFVRTRSLGMYLRILLRTLPEVWTGANSW